MSLLDQFKTSQNQVAVAEAKRAAVSTVVTLGVSAALGAVGLESGKRASQIVGGVVIATHVFQGVKNLFSK